ncbi:unnamed protein product, partial [Meganyctiphanes norvegica]
GCSKKDFGHGSVVCVCTDDYCDSLPQVKLPKSKDVLIITSNKDGLRWNITHQNFSQPGNEKLNSQENVTKIHINESVKFQSIFGFGGAFTDAAGLNIISLTPPMQDKLIRSYYSSEGLEYNLGRVPIGGTDFSTRPYTYDDLTNNKTDKSLNNFSLANEDYQYKIPIVQAALKMSSTEVKLLASPWSAPAWMKDNQNLKGKGKLIKEYYYTWALYIS